MTEHQRDELITELAEKTKIRREYYESLSDERLTQEWDKLRLIY